MIWNAVGSGYKPHILNIKTHELVLNPHFVFFKLSFHTGPVRSSPLEISL